MLSPSPSRWLLLAGFACAVGCGDGVVRFERDETLRLTLVDGDTPQIDTVLADLFGTPDEPRLPAELASLLDEDRLKQAAGPVISHEVGVTQGLYRRHCARCHGVTGDGRGPTARYQSPYPRDFRRGVFKWKSTYRDAPPTADDLHATLVRGVPGTSMPSFRLLSEDERETLRQYVVYLAIRGQVERALVDYFDNELGPGTEFSSEDRRIFGEDWLQPIIYAWANAEQRTVQPNDLADLEIDERLAIGRELYHSERAGCYKCHGPEGQGGATAGKDYEVDYDVWNRVRLNAPAEANALPARVSRPREIIGSTLHGGSQRLDLWRRLHQGVAGTTMPAFGGLAPGERGALTDDEVMSLAAYVETLLGPSDLSGLASQ